MDVFFLDISLTLFRFLVYILIFSAIANGKALADEKIKLKPLIITSSRIFPESGDERVPVRSQDSLPVSGIDAASQYSAYSVLKEDSLVDVRTRGPYGVQADLSIRGAPFEENLVLLDGVSLNDPKTGHHNMDLPVTLFDLERIDITYGPASSVYGSGSMGGAVNFILKECGDKPEMRGSASTGPWDFFDSAVSLNIPAGPFKNRSSLEWKRNTGFAPETEFDILTASSYSQLEFRDVSMDLFLGYHTKQFGADSFYSGQFTNEEEAVNTGLIIARGNFGKDTVSIIPTVWWKRLQDKFILDRNRPSFSRNDHTTDNFGGEISCRSDTGLGSVVFGGNAGAEGIESTSLDNHARTKAGAFFEYEGRFMNLLLNASARLDCYSTFGPEFSPSVNAGAELLPGFTVRAGVARSFRVPTFTELYYDSPANRGNAGLGPESAWNYEAGFNSEVPGIVGSWTIFLRNTDGMIDWTRTGAAAFWRSENIGKFDMYGLEAEVAVDFVEFTDRMPFRSFTVKYAFLEGTGKKGIVSKYVLEYLKHNFEMSLFLEFPYELKQKLDFSFRKRIGSDKYFLMDTVIYRDFALETGQMTLFIRIENIFNTAYKEAGNIDMPGRALFGGASVKF